MSEQAVTQHPIVVLLPTDIIGTLDALAAPLFTDRIAAIADTNGWPVDALTRGLVIASLTTAFLREGE